MSDKTPSVNKGQVPPTPSAPKPATQPTSKPWIGQVPPPPPPTKK